MALRRFFLISFGVQVGGRERKFTDGTRQRLTTTMIIKRREKLSHVPWSDDGHGREAIQHETPHREHESILLTFQPFNPPKITPSGAGTRLILPPGLNGSPSKVYNFMFCCSCSTASVEMALAVYKKTGAVVEKSVHKK